MMEELKMMMVVMRHEILNQCMFEKMEDLIKVTLESYVLEVYLQMMTRMNVQ